MKSYQWFTLLAALLITVCEVLVFTSESGEAPQQQASSAALTDGGSSTHASGG
jgi:hypothetical protein